MKKFWIAAAVAAAADLVSKYYIFAWLIDAPQQAHVFLPGWLRFSLHINEGAVWGMGGDHPTLLLLITAVIIPVVWMTAWSCRHERAPLWALGILLGGAAGNLYDRVFTSVQLNRFDQPVAGVRDFVDMGIPGVYNWPVYNVADVAIVLGVVVFAFWNLFCTGKKVVPAEQSDSSGQSGQPQP